jgi:N-acetylmuramoyl-L-alanine amidase
MKNNILSSFRLLLLIFIWVQCGPLWAQDSQMTKKQIRTIVLDPGHGGTKPGAVGKKSKEKDIVLEVSLKLGKAIEQAMPGVKVLYTRTTDVDVDLDKRIDMANKNKADLFISVHCNAAGLQRVRQGNRTVNRVNTAPNGTETLVSAYGRLGSQDVAVRENADALLEDNYEERYAGIDPNDPESYLVFTLLKNQYRNQSIEFATILQEKFGTSGRPNRGVKEGSLLVLAYAGMPAVLTEIGFMSNPAEEDYMLSEKGQTEIIKNLVDAIQTYKKKVER